MKGTGFKAHVDYNSRPTPKLRFSAACKVLSVQDEAAVDSSQTGGAFRRNRGFQLPSITGQPKNLFIARPEGDTLIPDRTPEDMMLGETDNSRRNLLKLATISLVGLTAPSAKGMYQAQREAIQRPETPEQALDLLVKGNQRFVAHNLISFEEDLNILKAATEEHQEPFAAVLSCADSRVPVELVFDQSIGHVFVVRVAGNVATPDTIASLEYGAAVLGTKAILVLGHTNCGAVKATMAGKAVPGQISTLYQYIHPAITGANGDLTTASRQNASLQASVLREASPVLAELVKEKKLAIKAAIYDIGNGKVTMLAG
jgi:carbonic anhydrase